MLTLDQIAAAHGRTLPGVRLALGLTDWNYTTRPRMGALVCAYVGATGPERAALNDPAVTGALLRLAPGAVLGRMLAARRRLAGDGPEVMARTVVVGTPCAVYPAVEALRRVEEGTILPPLGIVQHYAADATDELHRWYGHTIHLWRQEIRHGRWWAACPAVDAAIGTLDGSRVAKDDLIASAYAATRGRLDAALHRRIRIMLTRRLRSVGYVCVQRYPALWEPKAGRRPKTDDPPAHSTGAP